MARGRRSFLGSVVLAAAALASACASEADPEQVAEVISESDERRRERSALEETFDQSRDLGLPNFAEHITAEEERCVERTLLSRSIDVSEALTEADAIEERVEIVDALFGCLADPASNPWLVELMRASIGSLSSSLEVSEAEVRCILGEALARDESARILVVGPGPGEEADYLAIFEGCLDQDNLDVILRVEGAGPQAYGDDPRLDSMHDDCTAGEARACDLLYLSAPVGSEYEAVGAGCGDPAAADGPFCTDLEIDESGSAPPESPTLPPLVDDCEAGDLTACDLLFQVAPLGSNEERVGNTCGGRIPVGAIPDCRTRLG